MIKHYSNALILSLVATMAFTACDSEADCSESGRQMVTCKFYGVNLETHKNQAKMLKYIHITEFKTDSIIINQQNDAKILSLPLRYDKDKTIFVLDYKINQKDTLYIQHKNQPFYHSLECGLQVKQMIEEVKYTKHLIDSISVINKEASTNGQENIQIFY